MSQIKERMLSQFEDGEKPS
jgi:hypothetical protein